MVKIKSSLHSDEADFKVNINQMVISLINYFLIAINYDRSKLTYKTELRADIQTSFAPMSNIFFYR